MGLFKLWDNRLNPTLFKKFLYTVSYFDREYTALVEYIKTHGIPKDLIPISFTFAETVDYQEFCKLNYVPVPVLTTFCLVVNMMKIVINILTNILFQILVLKD